jgi:hypothetical protein
MSSDDDYDFYYDETDEMFEDDLQPSSRTQNTSFNKRDVQFSENETSNLQRLTSDVVLANILPFICQKKTLSTIATVSKHLKKIVFSPEAELLWNENCKPFQFCIDTYCPTCQMRKRQQKGSMHGVLGFLEKCPIYNLKLHCFITDIPGTLHFYVELIQVTSQHFLSHRLTE